jgi:hypothetical protein
VSDRVVKSAAGEDVRVLDDQAWGELAGFPAGTKSFDIAKHLGDNRAAVLAVLWRDGPIEDPSGLAVGRLWDLALELADDVGSPTVLTASPMFAPCVERETKGKRTFSYRLVAMPERWLPSVTALARKRTPSSATRSRNAGTEAAPRHGSPTAGAVTASVPATPVDVLDVVKEKAAQARQEAPGAAPAVNGQHRPVREPTAVLGPSSGPAVDLGGEVASAVATALLAQVVQVLTKGPQGQLDQLQAALDDVQHRLGTSTSFVDRLRRQNREQADEIIALRRERDGLRQRTRAAESNLSAALSSDAQAVIDAEVRRQLDRLMRAKPTKRADIDADLDRLAEAVQ